MPRSRPGFLRRRVLAWLCATALPLRGARAAEFERGLLWRVGKPGQAPSHLYGTVHVDDPRVLELPPAVAAAFGASRHFVAELIDEPDQAQRFLRATRLPPDERLSVLAGPERYAVIRDRLAGRYGLPEPAVDRLQPWAAYLQLSRPPGASGEILDAALQRQARERGLRLSALETLERQLAALQSIPREAMLRLLEALARDHDRALAAIPALIDRWRAEDLAGMLAAEQRLVEAAPPPLKAAFDELLAQLVTRRNEQMVRTLLPWLDDGAVFVAVGALHLHGPQGLPARLAAAGWQVQAQPLRG